MAIHRFTQQRITRWRSDSFEKKNQMRLYSTIYVDEVKYYTYIRIYNRSSMVTIWIMKARLYYNGNGGGVAARDLWVPAVAAGGGPVNRDTSQRRACAVRLCRRRPPESLIAHTGRFLGSLPKAVGRADTTLTLIT